MTANEMDQKFGSDAASKMRDRKESDEYLSRSEIRPHPELPDDPAIWLHHAVMPCNGHCFS